MSVNRPSEGATSNLKVEFRAGLLRELVMLGYALCGSIATDAHGKT